MRKRHGTDPGSALPSQQVQEDSMASRRVHAYIGLGANVGDAAGTLAGAVRALAAMPGARLKAVSPLYRTRPVGVSDQPNFLNGVVGLEVSPGPDPETGALALLIALKQIERAFGRRQRERWGPRELDLDLLLFGPHRIKAERPAAGLSDDADRDTTQWLEVPHPAAAERLFVLAPLADLAPGLVPPGWPEAVSTARLRQERHEGPAAVLLVGEWDPHARSWTLTGGGS